MKPSYYMKQTTINRVRSLFTKYHGYGSAGSSGTYVFAVYEDGYPIAAYIWNPPSYGCAKSVAPECPSSVLSLSRMVAVPKDERRLNHVSKPLRRQMKTLIDRTRYPSLVTFSDSSLGHTGHVYKCSGWHKTRETERPYYLCEFTGKRKSKHCNGGSRKTGIVLGGYSTITRWENHIDKGNNDKVLSRNGWVRVPVPGKFWHSGNQAYKWVKPNHDIQ